MKRRLHTIAILALFSAASVSADAAGPLSLPAPVEAVRAALRSGDVEAAVEAAEDAVQRLAPDSRAWMWAGRAFGRQALEANLFTKMSWAGRARDAWQKAVELDPDNLDARLDLTSYYLQAPSIVGGGRDKAEAQIAEIAGRDAAFGSYARSIAAQVDKETEKVEPLLKEALALNPNLDRALLAYSQFLLGANRYDEATALWKAALARTPEDALVLYQRGRTAAVTGIDLEPGLTALDLFVKQTIPSQMPDGLSIGAAHWRRGLLLDKLGRKDDALHALQLAVELEPKHVDAKKDLERVRGQ